MPYQRFAVVVAGGSGTRMGADMPKQFLLLNEVPVLIHTVRQWLSLPGMNRVVVVLPKDHHQTWRNMAADYGISEEKCPIATGGATRTQSVFAGIETVAQHSSDPANTLVAIHDGVRPLFTHEMAEAAFALAAEKGGAVACVPVKASLRIMDAQGGTQPVDRSLYLEVQTPQTFRLDLLLTAFRTRPHDNFSDDASLFQAAGNVVVPSPGAYSNLKITTPEDLEVAYRLLNKNS